MRTTSPSLFNNCIWSALERGNQPWMARVELLNNAQTRENEAAQKKKNPKKQKKEPQKNSSTQRAACQQKKSQQHRKTLTQITHPFKHSAHPWKSYSIWSHCKIISQPSSTLICTSERLVLVLLHLQSPSVSVSPGWKTQWPRCGDSRFCIAGSWTCFRFLETFLFSSNQPESQALKLCVGVSLRSHVGYVRASSPSHLGSPRPVSPHEGSEKACISPPVSLEKPLGWEVTLNNAALRITTTFINIHRGAQLWLADGLQIICNNRVDRHSTSLSLHQVLPASGCVWWYHIVYHSFMKLLILVLEDSGLLASKSYF